MLVTLQEVKDRLGISTGHNDDFLNEQIQFVSDLIEDYCGRKFLQASYVETFYADEILEKGVPLKKIHSYHYPIISVTHFRINGEDISHRTRKPMGKFLRLDDLRIREVFDSDSDVLEISYDAGYVSTPSIIKEVCFGIIEERYNKYTSGVGLNFGSDVQSVSIPGTISIQFDYTLQNNERSRRYGQVIGNYANMLDPFRSERVCLGKIVESEID